MTPIFKNENVSKDDIGDHMKNYATEKKLLGQPRRTLIGSYIGNDILLATPLLKWYLNKGLEVTKIHEVIQYQPYACFKTFADQVSANRRKGDLDSSNKILADTFKLVGNSAYGKTLENLGAHTDVHYVGETECKFLIKQPLFRKCTPLTEDEQINEVEMTQSQVDWYLPLQIGLFVYQYAKLKMLQFYYDFLDRFVSRSDFQLSEMDTDSLYMALSAPTLDEVIIKDKRREFYSEYPKWFQRLACKDHVPEFIECKLTNKVWTMPHCCEAAHQYDLREPGLFKEEYQGDGIVALCSKTYFCYGEKDKFSCKGLNKHINTFNKNKYLDVLQTQKSGGGINRGFHVKGEGVFKYEQQRNSLSYLYIKRKVHDDRVTTTPLDI